MQNSCFSPPSIAVVNPSRRLVTLWFFDSRRQLRRAVYNTRVVVLSLIFSSSAFADPGTDTPAFSATCKSDIRRAAPQTRGTEIVCVFGIFGNLFFCGIKLLYTSWIITASLQSFKRAASFLHVQVSAVADEPRNALYHRQRVVN